MFHSGYLLLLRVIIFVQFSTLWIDALVNIPSVSAQLHPVICSITQTRRALAVVAAVSLCIVTDTRLSSQGLARYMPGYAALVVHGLSSIALDHTQRLLMPSLGTTFTIAASSLGAAIFSLPLYIFRVTVVGCPDLHRPIVSDMDISSFPLPRLLFLSYLWLRYLSWHTPCYSFPRSSHSHTVKCLRFLNTSLSLSHPRLSLLAYWAPWPLLNILRSLIWLLPRSYISGCIPKKISTHLP